MSMQDQENAERIRKIYLERDDSVTSELYRWDRPDVQFQKFQYRRNVTEVLGQYGWSDLSQTRILDVGCGSASWLASLQDWGASASNLYGIEMLDHRLKSARNCYPHLQLSQGDASKTSFPSGFFNLITMNTVLSSVLSPEKRSDIANEMKRILSPNGLLLIYDFAFSNPSNPNVCGIPKSEIRRTYGDYFLRTRSLTLFPPLARFLSRWGLPLAAVIEWSVPLLRTHRLYCLSRGEPKMAKIV